MMFLPVIGFALIAIGIWTYKGKGYQPKRLPIPNITDAQVALLASQVKVDASPSGFAVSTTVDLFRHLGELNAARVATMAMSLGGNVSSIIQSLQHAKTP